MMEQPHTEKPPLVDIFVGPAWIIARCWQGETTWYLNEKEARTLETLITSAEEVRRWEARS